MSLPLIKFAQFPRYDELMPDLFYVKASHGYLSKTRRKFSHHTFYRGVLIIKKMSQLGKGIFFSAYHYDWKKKKKIYIQTEFFSQDIRLAVDKYLDTYQSQLVYNKERELKGLICNTKMCSHILCPHLSTCKGKLRVKSFEDHPKYYWVCGNHLFRRNDGELQMLDDFSSVFNPPDIQKKRQLRRLRSKINSLMIGEKSLLSWLNDFVRT